MIVVLITDFFLLRFELRFSRSAGGLTTAIFDQVSLEIIPGFEEEMAMTGGQASDWTETIIWTAGLTTTARLTNNSVQTLLSGHTFWTI